VARLEFGLSLNQLETKRAEPAQRALAHAQRNIVAEVVDQLQPLLAVLHGEKHVVGR
jgi:hypothetical protein